MQSLRCFVAVPLPEHVRASVVALQDRLRLRLEDCVRWERRTNLHVTLKFLGDVPVSDLPAVTVVVQQVAAVSRASTLVSPRADAFPSPKSPRVLVVCFDDPAGALAATVERLEQGLGRLGYHRERRRFRPHTTLGRVRQGRRILDLPTILAGLDTSAVPEVPVEELVLYQSELSPSGAAHTALCRVPLDYEGELAGDETDRGPRGVAGYGTTLRKETEPGG